LKHTRFNLNCKSWICSEEISAKNIWFVKCFWRGAHF
jgi:hypothetical protein